MYEDRVDPERYSAERATQAPCIPCMIGLYKMAERLKMVLCTPVNPSQSGSIQIVVLTLMLFPAPVLVVPYAYLLHWGPC